MTHFDDDNRPVMAESSSREATTAKKNGETLGTEKRDTALRLS